ncbi:MAG: hypothetical protein ABIN37_13080 [Burkholderiaceae bacterium]
MLMQTLAACDGAPADSATDAVGQRLVGTWLREYEEAGVRVRRVLVLERDGSFREMSSIHSAEPEAPQSSSTGSGDWLFDGTNLKRRYRLINGKPLSAPTIPYATFEVRFPAKSEFIGVDHVRKLEVHYERVAEGTQP